MNKYKYEKYNYDFLPNKIIIPKDYIITNTKIEDNILYITYYTGLKSITININVNNLINN